MSWRDLAARFVVLKLHLDLRDCASTAGYISTGTTRVAVDLGIAWRPLLLEDQKTSMQDDHHIIMILHSRVWKIAGVRALPCWCSMVRVVVKYLQQVNRQALGRGNRTLPRRTVAALVVVVHSGDVIILGCTSGCTARASGLAQNVSPCPGRCLLFQHVWLSVF